MFPAWSRGAPRLSLPEGGEASPDRDLAHLYLGGHYEIFQGSPASVYGNQQPTTPFSSCERGFAILPNRAPVINWQGGHLASLGHALQTGKIYVSCDEICEIYIKIYEGRHGVVHYFPPYPDAPPRPVPDGIFEVQHLWNELDSQHYQRLICREPIYQDNYIIPLGLPRSELQSFHYLQSYGGITVDAVQVQNARDWISWYKPSREPQFAAFQEDPNSRSAAPSAHPAARRQLIPRPATRRPLEF